MNRIVRACLIAMTLGSLLPACEMATVDGYFRLALHGEANFFFEDLRAAPFTAVTGEGPEFATTTG